MSLFAGTGFFTQSAVLFPTSIEKNKKTEACSRDPQASSSSWERKAPAALFHRGEVGEANPGEGVGGAAGLRIAKSLRSLHLPCKSTGNNQPERGLLHKGGWAWMPGQHCPGGLIPKEPQIRGPALPSQQCFWLRLCQGLPPCRAPLIHPLGRGCVLTPRLRAVRPAISCSGAPSHRPSGALGAQSLLPPPCWATGPAQALTRNL